MSGETWAAIIAIVGMIVAAVIAGFGKLYRDKSKAERAALD